MSLWRLPPVVIIQLKRFQFTQHMRRKLRDFVAFPVEGLDLSRIMAADTAGPRPVVGTNSSGEGIEKKPAPMEDDKPFTNGETNGGSHGADDTSRTEDESTDTPMTTPDSGRSEMLYDLYGVVHHQGALSGGHYVASLKSDLDGQWRLFNDAQIYEIHSRDVVDSSAYILFYIRRDVMKSDLSDFWETTPREGGCLTEEDMDKLIRGRSDRCVIS
jgi:ubiquitin carboxyl-terminal hydrolase 6/32